MTPRCRWCGRPERGNPGDYYHEKQCHREDVIRRMEIAKKVTGDDNISMEKLERELAEASYTGD